MRGSKRGRGAGPAIRRCVAVLAAGLCAMVLPIAQAPADDGDAVTIGAGVYDVTDDRTTVEFRAEYVFGGFDYLPFVGLMATGEGGAYAHAGVGFDFEIADRIILTPSFTAGVYANGNGKKLGHTVEFRSGAALAYRLEDGSKLGIGVYHLSNAGLGSINPGVESVMLLWTMPIDVRASR